MGKRHLFLPLFFTSFFLVAAPHPPGLSFLASKNILVQPQEWKEQRPIDTWAFGSHVKGIAKTETKSIFFLLPNSQRIEGYMEISGTTISSTSATQKKVSVYSTSTTTFQGKKSLTIDSLGPAFNKAQTTAVTKSAIQGVKAAPPFAAFKRQIALKKAKQLKPQANAMTTATAIKEINATLDEKVAAEANKAWGPISQVFQDPTLEPLKLGEMTWSSMADGIRIDGLHSLAGLPPSPFAQTLSTDLQINVSALSLNETLKAIAGKEYDLGEAILHGELGEFKIAFAKTNPIIFRTDKNQVAMTIELDRLIFDTSKLPARQISVAYHIAKTANGLDCTRVGDLTILPPHATATTVLTPEDKDLAEAVRKEIELFFPDRFEIAHLPFKGVTVQFDSFATLQDWLQINLSFLKN